MIEHSAQQPAPLNRLIREFLRCLAFASAVYTMVAATTFISMNMDFVLNGRTGIAFGVCDAERFCKVRKSHPGPAMSAGVRVNDLVRFERPFDKVRSDNGFLLPGEHITVHVRRPEGVKRVSFVTSPQYWAGSNGMQKFSNNILTLITVATVVVGLLMVLRSRRQTSVLLLGVSLVLVTVNLNPMPYWWWRDPMTFGINSAAQDAAAALGPLMLFAFAGALRRETSGRVGRVARTALLGLATVSAAWMVIAEWLLQTGQLTQLGAVDTGGLTPASWISTVLADLAYLGAIVTLAIGRGEAKGLDRRRYDYIFVSVSAIVFSSVFNSLPPVTGGWDPTRNPLVLGMDVVPVVGLLILSYAVLRHRVLDIGFAVNRTVTYGAVSGILLAAFGLIEWAVDHFAPIKGREENALVDAVVALGVFLTFHRVRDVVEHVVESVFFGSWQRAEARLRTFVREASFFTERPALIQAFVRAISAYADGAVVVVYLPKREGYIRVDCLDVDGFEHTLPADLGALVRLRAQLSPTEISDEGFPASLLAPMVHRNQLVGFAAVGPKPSGLGFRPDEIELIGWATRQVGLDLQALDYATLEERNEELGREVAQLTGKLDLALSVLSPRS